MKQDASTQSSQSTLEHGQTPPRSVEELTFEELSSHFDVPLKKACERLGVGRTLFKKICRRQGIPRWPFRRLRSIDRSIKALTTRLADPTFSSAALQVSLTRLRAERSALYALPVKQAPSKSVEAFTFVMWHPEEGPATCSPDPSPASPEVSAPSASYGDLVQPNRTPLTVYADAVNIPPVSSRKLPPPPVMEPNLQWRVTPFGILQRWQIPSMTSMEGRWFS